MTPSFFAAAGDIHGDHAALVARLDETIERLGAPLDFILHVGDFEPVRDESDLLTMSGPDQRRQLGSFHRVLSGELRYPAEVLFIGGNHEPYAWLEEFPDGGEIAPGIYYMGRASVIVRADLRIAGLTGIHSPKRYDLPMPANWTERKTTLKEPTYFRKPHVDKLLAAGPVDILLTHDWPSGHFGPFGNWPTRALLDTLQPRLHLAGHIHRPARKTIIHPTGRETLFIALNHVGFGRDDIVLFRWDGATLSVVSSQ
ncbi:MAG: metallophosphoesterase [Ardenticatenaceae bacterium]